MKHFEDVANGLHAGDAKAVTGTSARTEVVALDAGDLHEFIELAAKGVTRQGTAAYSELARFHALKSDNGDAVKDVAKAVFLEAYLRAYFRNGNFASGEVTFNDLKSRIPQIEKIENAAAKKEVEDALKKIAEKLKGNLSFGKVGDASFVTRGETSIQFPPYSVSIDPTKGTRSFPTIDMTVVSSQFVRVVLEALFDASYYLPAVAKATGVKLDLGEGREHNVRKLSAFETIKPADGYSFDKTDFANTEEMANRAESAAVLVIGRAIRGIGPVALNNESIAKFVETTFGVVARKYAEKASWCWYAAMPNKPVREQLVVGENTFSFTPYVAPSNQASPVVTVEISF